MSRSTQQQQQRPSSSSSSSSACCSTLPSSTPAHNVTPHRRLSGPLLKRRDHLSFKWKPRLFTVLTDEHLLLYYLPSTSPKTSPPRGVLPLAGCEVMVLDREEAGGNKPYAFRLSHPWLAKAWVLAARSYQEREHWVRSLRRLINEAEEELREDIDGRLLESFPEDEDDNEIDERRPQQLQQQRAQTEQPIPHPPHMHSLVWPGYEESTRKSLRLLIDFAEPSEGWRLNFEKHGVKAYKRETKSKNESFTTLKGVGMIRHHPIAVMMAIIDNTIGREIDPQYEDGERVVVLNDHNWIDYLKYKGIFPVAPRDMYLYVHWRILDEQDGSIIIAVYSDDAHNPRPAGRGCVRAECLTAGWILRPVYTQTPTPTPTQAQVQTQTHTHCTYFSMADLKGFIPKALVDIATDPQPLLIHTIGQVLSKEKTGKFSVDTSTFTGPKRGAQTQTQRVYKAADVVPYVNRMHRCNMPWDKVLSFPWLLTEEEWKVEQSYTDTGAARQRRSAAQTAAGGDGGGGGGRAGQNAALQQQRQETRISSSSSSAPPRKSSSSSSPHLLTMREALWRAFLVLVAVAFFSLLPLLDEARQAPSWSAAKELLQETFIQGWHWMCLYAHAFAYHVGIDRIRLK